MHIPETTLKKLLLDSSAITPEQFETAQTEAKRSGRTIENALIGKGEIPETYFAELLANHFGVEIIDLRTVTVPHDVLRLLPEDIAKEKGVIIFLLRYLQEEGAEH